MFIQTEETPNPNSLKFMLESIITESKSYDYTQDSQELNANKSNEFAGDMFTIGGVQRVFIYENFITVTKGDGESWDILKPQILSLIMDYLSSGKSIIPIADSANDDDEYYEDDEEREIAKLIREMVKPAVAMDGGDIQFVAYDKSEKIVYVSMRGSCSGCPSSGATLKDGVKRMLQHYLSEEKILDVVPV